MHIFNYAFETQLTRRHKDAEESLSPFITRMNELLYLVVLTLLIYPINFVKISEFLFVNNSNNHKATAICKIFRLFVLKVYHCFY